MPQPNDQPPAPNLLERNGMERPMSRRGDCLDDASMESFFASRKTEHVHPARFRTREQARAAAFDQIEIFYNRKRLHSAAGYGSPGRGTCHHEQGQHARRSVTL